MLMSQMVGVVHSSVSNASGTEEAVDGEASKLVSRGYEQSSNMMAVNTQVDKLSVANEHWKLSMPPLMGT